MGENLHRESSNLDRMNGGNTSSSGSCKLYSSSCDVPQSSGSAGPRIYQYGQQNGQTVPPPVPPRPTNFNYNQYVTAGYTPSYAYSPYGRYPTSSLYSPYTGYGALGYGARYGFPQSGINPYAEVGEAETALIRMAEESSRPAFQSIESLVNTVGSISMMLESTYHAVYNSYRAVLGVVENFSRLKNHLAHVISTLALIRTLHWIFLRLLYYLRLRKTNPAAEAAWSAATSKVLTKPSGEGAPSHSAWPIVVFLSMVFGAPWLIFRIFSKMAAKKRAETADSEEVYYAEALYEFHAAQPGELSVKPGQQLTVAPKDKQPKVRGWALVYADSQRAGLVPTNYIRIYRKRGPNRPSTSINQPMANGAVPSGNIVRTEHDDASRNAEHQGQIV